MKKIIILSQEVDPSKGNRSKVHQVMLDAIQAGKARLTFREMMRAVGFRSPAPLDSCLYHLEVDGKIKIVF